MISKFINSKKKINRFSHPVTLSLLISLYVFLPNEAFCSNTEQTNSIEELQELVRRLIAEANEDDLNDVNQEIRNFQGPRQINPPQGWPNETNTENQNNNSVWTPVVLYVLLSTSIIVISLYHREILNILFDMGKEVVTAIPRATMNLVNMRTQTFTEINNMLTNPANHQFVRDIANNLAHNIAARRVGGADI